VNRKLVTHLGTRKNYVVDIRTLRFYMSQGMVVTKVHRAISFDQKPWLRPWIEFNTRHRVVAIANGNDADKDRYKLANNAVFGKNMENVRARRTMKFSTSREQLGKRLRDTQLIRWDSVAARSGSDRTLWLTEHRPNCVCLDKPIYGGVSILDLSKQHMYSYWYDELQPRVCADGDWSRLRLGMTDTDSILYSVRHDDWQEIKHSMRHLQDTSVLGPDHRSFIGASEGVPGLMKDELKGVPLQRSTNLRAKCYAYQTGATDKPDTKKLCKGVSRVMVKKAMTYDMYARALKGETHYQSQWMMRSSKQRIYTLCQRKKALSCYDDKRFILADGINSLAYGHHLLTPQKSQPRRVYETRASMSNRPFDCEGDRGRFVATKMRNVA
jgi:hypothetical protein